MAPKNVNRGTSSSIASRDTSSRVEIIYLAAPYSHPDQAVREKRFEAVNRVASRLMDQGHIVFSPISLSHPISQYTEADACDSNYWLRQDLSIMPICTKMVILCWGGWSKSKGIKREMREANRLGIPIVEFEEE